MGVWALERAERGGSGISSGLKHTADAPIVLAHQRLLPARMEVVLRELSIPEQPVGHRPEQCNCGQGGGCAKRRKQVRGKNRR